MAKPGPSDWGKINAGQPYGPLTVDMDRAFNWVPLGVWQRRLLQYIRENSWGVAKRKRRTDAQWPDPVACQLNVIELAREWGIPHQRLYEARRWLVASNMVGEDEDGLWVNKTGSEWVDPETGEKLLSESGLRHCIKARASGKKGGRNTEGGRKAVHSRRRVNAEAGERVDESAPVDDLHARGPVNADPDECTPESECTSGVHSRQSVNANAVHSRRRVNAEAGAFTPARADPSIQYAREDPTGLIQDPTGYINKTVVGGEGAAHGPKTPAKKARSTKPRDVPDSTIDEVAAWARKALTDYGSNPPFDRGEEGFVYNGLRAWLASYDRDWVEDAILCAGVKPNLKAKDLASYVNGCLRRWHANGGPDVGEVGAARKRLPAVAPPRASDRKIEVPPDYDVTFTGPPRKGK